MRCFIGVKIEPTPQIMQKLEFLGKFQGVKPVEPWNIHICLKFLGEIEDNDIKKIIEIMKTIEHDKFEIELKGIDAFPNIHMARTMIIHCISDELKSIQKELDDKLEKIGFNKENREFSSHVTLARIKTKPPKELKDMFSQMSFGRFKAEKIDFVKSELSQKGPAYTILYSKELR